MFVNGKFKVQKKMCDSCIYSKNSASFRRVEELEHEITDKHGFFNSWRECHKTDKADGTAACCRGFWNKHKDDFQVGQVAQRLNLVEEV